MDFEDDEILLEDEETATAATAPAAPAAGRVDPRRLIERRLELRRLREQLEDPGFCYDFD